jgi:hypothetical protein
MRRNLSAIVTVGPALATGCGPADLVMYDDPMALEFAGDGCVSSTGDPLPVQNSLTVEAWVRPSSAGTGETEAIVSVGSQAMLWLDGDGVGFGQPLDLTGTGWRATLSLHDEQRHHVAATWNVTAGGSLYVDGQRVAAGSTSFAISRAPDLALGCAAGAEERGYVGVLDEVRISSVSRYSADFAPAGVPFVDDGATLAMWHLDTGLGDVAFEILDRYNGDIDEAEWVTGLIDRP